MNNKADLIHCELVISAREGRPSMFVEHDVSNKYLNFQIFGQIVIVRRKTSILRSIPSNKEGN
jgi:hypothetical protein